MDQEKEYFRSDYVFDLEIQKEFSKGLLFARPLNRISDILIIIILGAFFVLMVPILDAPGEYSRFALILSVLYLVLGLIQALLQRGGGVHFKRMVYSNGGKAPLVSVRFLEDRLLAFGERENLHNSFSYDQIRSVYETENLYLLGVKYRMFQLVDKRTLTGSPDAFVAFLKQRCSRIKKVPHATSGKLLYRVRQVVILLTLVLGILNMPALQLRERLAGQIHNGMSCSEIAQELETFGISGLDEDALDSYDVMYRATVFMDGSKLKMLLQDMGMGPYDYETNEWSLPEGGVYFFPYYSYSQETMYADLLSGLASMTGGALSFRDVREEYSPEGDSVTVSFTLNDSAYSMDTVNYGEWYDENFLNLLNGILSDTGKQLYFADNDGYSCFIFYRDDSWAERFSARTGLELVTDIYEIY